MVQHFKFSTGISNDVMKSCIWDVFLVCLHLLACCGSFPQSRHNFIPDWFLVANLFSQFVIHFLFLFYTNFNIAATCKRCLADSICLSSYSFCCQIDAAGVGTRKPNETIKAAENRAERKSSPPVHNWHWGLRTCPRVSHYKEACGSTSSAIQFAVWRHNQKRKRE